jgi:polysaccharide biosynthesis protein PelA
MIPEPISIHRLRARAARSYAAYYGHDQLEVLTSYDVVILQPEAFAEPAVRALRDQGTLPLAYLSLSQEMATLTENQVDWLRLEADGTPMRDADWDSNLVDPAHPGWRERVLQQARAARAKGFVGLMLDTLDVADADDQQAVVKLIVSLRTHWHDAVIVMNRGFALLERVVGHVDGVIFESLSTSWFVNTDGGFSYDRLETAIWQENEALARSMAQFIAPQGLACWALDYADRNAPNARDLIEHARAQAAALGYVSFVTDRALRQLENRVS